MKNTMLFILVLSFPVLLFGQDGFVSEFHKTSVGKILFIKNADPDIATATEYVTLFTDKDEITGCVFVKPDDKGQVKYSGRIVVDGKLSGYSIESTAYKYAFIMHVLTNKYGGESADFSNFVRFDMANGEHKVKVEIWPRNNDGSIIIASGEFTINKGGAPAEVPTTKFSSIKAGMSNPTLEQQAVAVINTRAKNESWVEKYTKAKIVSTAWEVRKNPVTGAIEDRVIYMKLYGVWLDGTCQSVDFGFRQDYVGGKYSSLQFNSIGDMTPVICE